MKTILNFRARVNRATLLVLASAVALCSLNTNAYGAEPAPLCELPYKLNVYFKYDSTEINEAPKNFKTLDMYIKQECGVLISEIRGYTDTKGTGQYNIDLSVRRAKAVRQFLAREGYDVGSAKIIGYGEKNLFMPTQDGTALDLNRRVEVVLIKGPARP